MIWDQQNVYCACRAPKSVPSRCSAWIFAVAPEPEGKKNVCGLFVCPNSRYIWMDKFCCKWCYRFHTHTHKQQRCRNSSMVSLERQAGPNVSSTLCNKPESPNLAVAALYDRGHIYTSQHTSVNHLLLFTEVRTYTISLYSPDVRHAHCAL